MIPTGALTRRRILTLLCIMCVIFCIIVGQLINLQVVISQDLQARAQTQWTGRSRVSARRGEITDRNGTALALSATAYAVSASPRQVKDPEAFARELAAVLAGHAGALRCRFGSFSVNAKTNLVCDGETLYLYLRDTQLQSLAPAAGQDAADALASALHAAYGALCRDAAAAGADLYHFAFWRQCANKTGAADKPQPPRLIIVS